MENNYISLCKKFYSATKIPVSLLKGKQAVYNSFDDIIGVTSVYYREDLFPMEGHDPCFCSDSPDINYGRLKIEGTEYNLILGGIQCSAHGRAHPSDHKRKRHISGKKRTIY